MALVSATGPLVVIHDLRHGRGHASRHGASRLTLDGRTHIIIWLALVPLALHHGGYGSVTCGGCHRQRRILLYHLNLLGIALQHGLGGGSHLPLGEVTTVGIGQDGTHGIIAGHDDKTLIVSHVEHIIQRTRLGGLARLGVCHVEGLPHRDALGAQERIGLLESLVSVNRFSPCHEGHEKQGKQE